MWWITMAMAGAGDVKAGLKHLQAREYGQAATLLSRAIDGGISGKWKDKALVGRAQARAHLALDTVFDEGKALEAAADYQAAREAGMDVSTHPEREELLKALLQTGASVPKDDRRRWVAAAHGVKPALSTQFLLCGSAVDLAMAQADCGPAIDWPTAPGDSSAHQATAAWVLGTMLMREPEPSTDAVLAVVDRGMKTLDDQREYQEKAAPPDRARSEETETRLVLLRLNILLRNNEKEGLVEAVQAALERQPDSANLVHIHARTLEDAGQWADAQRAYERSLSLDPKNADVHYGLGAMYVNQSMPLQKQANEADPADSKELEMQVRALMTKARKHLEDAHALEPNAPVLQALMVVCGRLDDTAAMETYKAELDTPK